MIARLVGAALLVLAATSPGRAQEDPHQIGVLGLGMTSCATWSDMHRVAAGSDTDQWVLGFLSGIATANRSRFLGTVQLSLVLQHLEQYCLANPQSVLALAGLEVAKQLNTSGVPNQK